MSLIRVPKNIEEMQREGLARWAMQEPREIDQIILPEFCERALSSYPVVGFNTKGEALIECETIAEAVCVPDVAIVRSRDFSLRRGFRFERVAFKMFKSEGK